MVPVNVLEHFLEDVHRHGGRYLGFPRLGVSLQNLESPSLRGSLKMSPQQTGIMITGAEVGELSGMRMRTRVRWLYPTWTPLP